MLDTNICIHAMKHRPSEVLAQLRANAAAGLGISSITAAELHFGVAQTGSARNQAALRQFLEPLEIAHFDAVAAETCGRLRAALEQAGTPIGPLDTQIAAQALALDVTLVSHNLRAFACVPGLRLVSWVSTPA
ncbi:MAG: type II toxin-antitoxin system VapC family toxin [Aquabacterium sp.]|nr:type II toxin-antitoxin system VapC family toxin [Aquabacterium sp.]